MATTAQFSLNRSLIKPVSLDRWPRGITYRGGFRILGTPLGFGNAVDAGLRFMASLNDCAPKRGERLLSSVLLSKTMVPERGLDVLALDFGQRIRLGQMTLEIFSAGLGPGSAQLQVAIKDRRILYCGGIRMARPLVSAPSEVPKCDLLLLDAAPADPKPPAPATSAKSLAKWLIDTLSDRRTPVLVFGSTAAAFDAVFAASTADVRLRAQRRIFEMVRRASPLLPLAGTVLRLEQRLPKKEGVLISMARWPKSPLFNHKGVAAAYVGPGRSVPPWAESAFRLGESEDRSGLAGYVRETGAAQVALSDACGVTFAEILCKQGIENFRIAHPEQMPLPFR
jgi:hypothetical protein